MLRVHHLISHLKPAPTANELNDTAGIFGHHDLGASSDFLDQSLHRDVTSLTYWERKMDAFLILLTNKKMFTWPKIRKELELIPKKSYLSIAYYEKWIFAATQYLLNNGVITEHEIITRYRNHPQIRKLQSIKAAQQHKYCIGDTVKVRNVCDAVIQYENWRLFLGLNEKSHVRAPGYIVNKTGVIQSYFGVLPNDELRAFGIKDATVPVYKVRFKHNDIYPSQIPNNDTIDVEIVSHWLQKEKTEEEDMEHDEHDTEHKHDHHEERAIVERNAVQKEATLSAYEVLSEVIISLCCHKKIVTMNAIHAIIEQYDTAKELNLAPKIVLKAWKDEEWKRKLIQASNDGIAKNLIAETFNVPLLFEHSFILKVVQNDEHTHNVICCTLCSCYPRPLLGLPPHWYKSSRYRSEIISKPRELLQNEFGCVIPMNMTLRVHDSTSVMRYIVLPHTSQVPQWQSMSDAELESIITRDMVIGVKR